MVLAPGDEPVQLPLRLALSLPHGNIRQLGGSFDR